MSFASMGERLLLTLWVGSLWAIGFIAVPLAFIHFEDAAIAGAFAGRLFSLVDYIGLACGTVLVMAYAFGRHTILGSWRFWVTLSMLVLVAVLHFYFQAEMAAIKTLYWRQDTLLSARFDLLHQLSTGIYLVISILGLALVVTTDREASHG